MLPLFCHDKRPRSGNPSSSNCQRSNVPSYKGGGKVDAKSGGFQSFYPRTHNSENTLKVPVNYGTADLKRLTMGNVWTMFFRVGGGCNLLPTQLQNTGLVISVRKDES